MATRVLVAGASGTLGRPLVETLVAGGYEVVGLTRTPAKRPALRALGAEAVVADALDADALRAAMRRAAPEVVVHLLTALPAGGPTKAWDLTATNRLRRTGTANLLGAAVAAGARRLVAESMVLVHGFGDFGTTPLTEAEPLRPPGRVEAELVGAVRDLERQVLEADAASRIEGVVLRYGMLYGAATGSTQAMARTLRRRQLPLWLSRLVAPFGAGLLTTRLPVSNAKARRELGWAPAFPTYRDGLAELPTARTAVTSDW